ncbi:unnamed protein product [Prorocentrum cordatum]|uniref:Uncharacterized protein n=1 Tax=Prorocentrum cordatum TaxID=2364126 RepID=A0ABN9PSQ7_9DINO|nr:unnamed protein product [Polarella glacialis]
MPTCVARVPIARLAVISGGSVKWSALEDRSKARACSREALAWDRERLSAQDDPGPSEPPPALPPEPPRGLPWQPRKSIGSSRTPTLLRQVSPQSGRTARRAPAEAEMGRATPAAHTHESLRPPSI